MNSSGQIYIVLVEPSNPGNIGAVARAAKTMAIENLVLVNPKCFPDKQATVRATGAVDVLERAVVCGSLQDAVSNCAFVVGTSSRKRGLPPPEITPRELGRKVWQELRSGSVAIVFGRESSGLSNEEMDLCHCTTMIPANWEFGSLNIAAAVQVICYEVFMATLPQDSIGMNEVNDAVLMEQVPVEVSEGDGFATSMELEQFFAHLQQVLLEIKFLDPKQPKLLMRRLRNLYYRTRMTRVEVNILRGILSAIQKSLKD